MRIFLICLILSLAILILLACEETLIDHDHPHEHDHETSEQSVTTEMHTAGYAGHILAKTTLRTLKPLF